MKKGLKYLIVPLCAGLGACAMIPSPGEAVAHKVSVNGETYLVSQLTASTWIATSAGVAQPWPTTAAGTAGLGQAIEKTSGCKVTDSDYSREGRQFDAQVDCGGLTR